jgi:asparagine synthase (glutamine-hydrolysing)
LLWYKVTQGLLPVWLRMEDRMSMAFSIESRAPFLDHRLVELAFGLPDDMKLRNGYTKHVLRQAMRDRLPAPIAFSHAKRKFATPYLDWLRGSWRPVVEDLLLGSCEIESHLDLPALRPKMRAYMAGDPDAIDGRLLWRLLTTEIFLRSFADPAHLAPNGARGPAVAFTTQPASMTPSPTLA